MKSIHPKSTYKLSKEENKGWIFGIGGFLFLPLGLLFATVGLHCLSLLGDLILPLIVDGDWKALTTPGAEYYHPLWKKIIFFDVIKTLLIIVFGTFLLIGFLRNKLYVPVLMIIWFLIMCLIQGIEYYYIFDISLDLKNYEDPLISKLEFRHAFAQSVFWALMLIPYFIISKRVKWTFIK